MERIIDGYVVLIDDEDAHLLDERHFFVVSPKNSKTRYVRTSGYGVRESLHRLIMGRPLGKHVDHINGNGLDNRRENLRVCTTKENIRNQGLSKRNTSGHRGVYWNKALGRWCANICVNYKTIYLGLYESLEDAVSARRQAELQYFGEYAPK